MQKIERKRSPSVRYSSSSSSSISIPQTAAAGGITLTQPPQTSTSFYKIASGQPITFGWNFTSVLVNNTHLTVSAICDNGNTYPVGPTDGVIAGTATSVVWDLYSYNQAHSNTPLAQASYTLNIWGDLGRNAARAPGYMSPNTALKFALYTPQPYTPISSGWQCTGCSGSVSAYAAHPAFAGIIATLVIMLITGFGLLRNFSRFAMTS
ncbi:hypothetical protein PLICRDRAFT_95190 [Plicaturopsis crispa FD-325 SS-3]|uniref:DUF7137 domain-containing protein n=1 Tax=Plicaturopsis crispa FD-325 SS-3 TaxID=944288 RepID=A0A0C9SXV2_PLICR|nr:hypothetical protein PLICRDRAFT_95190 [Plicaturopsis crispa FD-325 SS-3]